jgi:hypothetical protein
MQIILSLLIVILTVFSCTAIDASKLTHTNINGVLVDKWHEESCTPIIDGNGNYLGESCSDEYTIVVVDDSNERHECQVSYADFGDLLTKSPVIVSYDIGRLGIYHNFHLESK